MLLFSSEKKGKILGLSTLCSKVVAALGIMSIGKSYPPSQFYYPTLQIWLNKAVGLYIK